MEGDDLDEATSLRARFEGMETERLKDLLRQSYLKEESRQIVRGVLQSRGIDEDTRDLTEDARAASRTIQHGLRPVRVRRPGAVTAIATLIVLYGIYLVVGPIWFLIVTTKDGWRLTDRGWLAIGLSIALGVGHFVVAAALMDGKNWARLTWLIGTAVLLLISVLAKTGGVSWALAFVLWLASVVVLARRSARDYFAPGVIRSRYGATR